MYVHIYEYSPIIEVLQSTASPANLVACAAKTTQVLPHEITSVQAASEIVEAVIEMGHTSVLEHAVITMCINRISRGIATQLTRHRMGSFTQSSTHYADHSEVRHFVDKEHAGLPATRLAITTALQVYDELKQVEPEISKETRAEARQVLPASAEARVIWTVNARALLNFLRIRLCKRNMKEMCLLAEEVLIVAKCWFPEAFCGTLAEPDCFRIGCKQGKMSCKREDCHDFISA